MKKLSVFLILYFAGMLVSVAQVNIYNPNANAAQDLEKAVAEANRQGKHVLVQIGGNWCPWCVKLHQLFTTDSSVAAVIDKSYVVVKINYSKENKNLEILNKLDKPQRFGFPVLVILNGNGQRIHTQDSGLLESGDGYDLKKVTGFLKNWTPDAIK